ncbi:uncharacterized protein TNCV_1416041 [Trichonephila clavipes]|nr:uncharacterized protein TNCV_1416041 [Trichonephila clavipes]
MLPSRDDIGRGEEPKRALHEEVKRVGRDAKSSLRDAEIILRAGQRIISEINILVENSQGSSRIPKSNPQLLNAEIKKKIARHENIKSMSFTRNGKIRFSTLDPVCAAQILSIEKISNVSVKTNILWEGITSRFLIYEIPLDISLNEIAKELQETNNFEIIEMRRFIKTGSQQQLSPVLITILGTTLPETETGSSIIEFKTLSINPDNVQHVLVFFILLDFAKKLQYVSTVVFHILDNALITQDA